MFLHVNTSLQLYMWHVLVRDETLNTIWIVQVCDEFSQETIIKVVKQKTARQNKLK